MGGDRTPVPSWQEGGEPWRDENSREDRLLLAAKPRRPAARIPDQAQSPEGATFSPSSRPGAGPAPDLPGGRGARPAGAIPRRPSPEGLLEWLRPGSPWTTALRSRRPGPMTWPRPSCSQERCPWPWLSGASAPGPAPRGVSPGPAPSEPLLGFTFRAGRAICSPEQLRDPGSPEPWSRSLLHRASPLVPSPEGSPWIRPPGRPGLAPLRRNLPGLSTGCSPGGSSSEEFSRAAAHEAYSGRLSGAPPGTSLRGPIPGERR